MKWLFGFIYKRDIINIVIGKKKTLDKIGLHTFDVLKMSKVSSTSIKITYDIAIFKLIKLKSVRNLHIVNLTLTSILNTVTECEYTINKSNVDDAIIEAMTMGYLEVVGSMHLE